MIPKIEPWNLGQEMEDDRPAAPFSLISLFELSGASKHPGTYTAFCQRFSRVKGVRPGNFTLGSVRINPRVISFITMKLIINISCIINSKQLVSVTLYFLFISYK